MDSDHSESEFCYPDEVEKFSDRKYRVATERKPTKGSVYDGECAKVNFNTMSRKHGGKNRIRPTRAGNATIISKKPATVTKRQELQTEHSQKPRIPKVQGSSSF